MQIFSKVLRDTDVRVRFSFPTHCLLHLDFAGNNSVDLHVKDSSGELRVIRCLKRKEDYDKPVLSKGWLKFVADYGLRVGDNNLRVFGSVVVIAFQSAFHSEKYANNIFLFFKNHF